MFPDSHVGFESTNVFGDWLTIEINHKVSKNKFNDFIKLMKNNRYTDYKIMDLLKIMKNMGIIIVEYRFFFKILQINVTT